VFSIDAATLAQVHWDVGAQLGVMQRLTTDRDVAAREPDPGPVGELHAHIAVLPMLRLGPYLAHDVVLGAVDRQTTEAGLRAKITPPLLAHPWKAWAFLGFGYARSYRPSHSLAQGPVGSGHIGGVEGGIGGGLIGVGVGTRFRAPWLLYAEVAGRFGLAFSGAMYDRTPCGCLRDPYPGHDSFAASLSVGLSLEP
jgi:hypothetical protein